MEPRKPKEIIDRKKDRFSKIEEEISNLERDKTEGYDLKIEKLLKEAGVLLDQIDKLEREIIESTDNLEVEAELEPIIAEAAEIRKKLEALQAEEEVNAKTIAELERILEEGQTQKKETETEDDTEHMGNRTYEAGTVLEWDKNGIEIKPTTEEPTTEVTEVMNEVATNTPNTNAEAIIEEPTTSDIDTPPTEPAPAPERIIPIEAYGNNPEVIKFIQEFNLKDDFPLMFLELTEEQKIKVIRDLKQRMTAMIETEALRDYENDLRYDLRGKNIIMRALIGLGRNITKEISIKNNERNLLNEYKVSELYREDLYKNAQTLISVTRAQEIYRNESGDLLVDFSERLGIGSGYEKLVSDYNEAANRLQSIPYEWSLEKEGSKHRLAYEKALTIYKNIEADVLKIRSYGIGGEEGAMIRMSELKSEIMLAQLVNTHPDIEEVFSDLNKGASGKDILKTLARMSGTQNTEKTALAVGGYLLRTGTRYAFGFIAAPVVGAVLGGLRAKMRAEDILQMRNKLARAGIQDWSKEASRMMDASMTTRKISFIIKELRKDLPSEVKIKKAQELRRRIEFTEQQLERGLVHFGTQEDALTVQYELLQAINNARIYVAINETEVDTEVNKRVEALLTYKGMKVGETQKKYIKDQMKRGAMYGAGFATFGYLLKYLTEHTEQIEQSTESNTEKPQQVEEKLVNEDTIKKPVSVAKPDEISKPITKDTAQTIVDTKNSAQENIEAANGNTDNQKVSKDNVISKEKSNVQKPFKDVGQDKKSATVKETPETKPKLEAPTQKNSSPVLDLAVVKKGEGVTFAFKQQIDANPELGKALAKQIGYAGKVGTPDFYKVLGEKFGYINEKGEWIGVKGTGSDTAYQFEKQGNGYVVNEYHKEGSAWVKGESHALGEKFEGSEYENKYEYFGKNKINSNRENASGILKPEKIERASDLPRPEKIEDTSGQFDRAPQRVADDNNGQLAQATSGKPRTELNKISSAEYWAKQNGNKKIEAGADSDLYGGKKDVKWGVAPGPDGEPWVVEDFTLDGGKAIRLFADRFGYEELTNKEVNFVGETYRYNLDKIFENSKNWTEHYSTMSAPKLLRMDVGDTIKGEKDVLSTYIKMLYRETGIKPFNDGWVGNKENAKDYILRMLLELEYKGKLDAFNANFDKFLKENSGN